MIGLDGILDRLALPVYEYGCNYRLTFDYVLLLVEEYQLLRQYKVTHLNSGLCIHTTYNQCLWFGAPRVPFTEGLAHYMVSKPRQGRGASNHGVANGI